jgi:hypothetical protein
MAVAAAMTVQGQTDPPALDRISAKVKNYLRSVTENRFDVFCQITAFDATGKVKKVRDDRHRLEFTQGRFRGPGQSEDTNWASTIHVTHANRATLGLQLFTDWDGLVTPAFAFANQKWILKASVVSGGSVNVDYRPRANCSTFQAAGTQFKYSGEDCGAGQIVLDADANPLRTTFEALGLPLPQGKRSLTSYRVNAEFQTVAVAGAREPLILPKSATATFTFSDEKIVVESRYTLHPGAW